MSDKKPDHHLSAPEKAISGLLEKIEGISQWQRRQVRRNKQTGPVRYATFNERVFATTIDVALLIFLFGWLSVWVSRMIHGDTAHMHPLAGVQQGTPPSQMIAHLYHTGFFHQLMLDYAAHYIVVGVLVLWCWHVAAATPGKWLLRMRIVDDETYCKPSVKQLFLRYLGYVLTLLPATLGALWVLVDRKNRGWHDIVARTVVVRVDHWHIRDDGTTPHMFPVDPYGGDEK